MSKMERAAFFGRKLIISASILLKKPCFGSKLGGLRSGNRIGPQKSLLIVKGDERGDLAPTKRFCGFDSRWVLGPVIPKTLKIGVIPVCMVLMMKWGPRNITGWPSVSIM